MSPFETDEFQLYSAGDYTYKIEGGLVTSMAIQIEDANNDKVIYNKILNALAKSNSVKDTHNTGGNYYQYANFQVQFDDFEGYEKLTHDNTNPPFFTERGIFLDFLAAFE